MISQKEFIKQLNSEEYDQFMLNTWNDRHNESAQVKWGVWRWRGMYENKKQILDIIKKSKKIVDFGGALGPLCPNAKIVDIERRDIWDRPTEGIIMSGKYGLMYSLDIRDVIFSSHTLEHVIDENIYLRLFHQILKKNGYLILHLPSVFNKEWWPEFERKKAHKRIFAIAREPLVVNVPLSTVFIDKKLENIGFNIITCKYVGDSSILCIARKI